MTALFRPEMTGDGSVTVYSDEYGQSMHSSSGAYDEAIRKHVIPSRLVERRDTVLRVLDVGFGLGYNILALVHALRVSELPCKVEVISFEKDRSAGPVLSAIHFDDSRDDLYAFILRAFHDGSCLWEGNTVTVLFGDARRTLLSIPDRPSFHAVFHDPFSPSKNPELWTVDFFRQVYSRMMTDGTLTTYSAAPQIRGALLDAGFSLLRGPSVGGKREGTIAVKRSVPDDSDGIRDELKCNHKAIPYRDPGLCISRGDILSGRIDEMAQVRLKEGRPVHQV